MQHVFHPMEISSGNFQIFFVNGKHPRTTFSDVPFIPEIFQWNEPKTCLPFTSQPEFPEFLGKWKTPMVSMITMVVSNISIHQSSRLSFDENLIQSYI